MNGRSMIQSLLILCSYLLAISSSPITDPLPSGPSTIHTKNIVCPVGKPFKWSKADPEEKGITVEYKCGDGGNNKILKLACGKGYKATYRKDLIPNSAVLQLTAKRASIAEGNPEPNFGLFASGKSLEVLDQANLVYACIKS